MPRKCALFFFILASLWFNCHPTRLAKTLSVKNFSNVSLYHESPHPRNVAVFISGDGGWGADLDGVADDLSTLDCLVIGVDITRYLESHRNSPTCIDLAADFSRLVRSVEQSLHYERTVPAVMIGHSAGASMVYGILMQAKPGAFLGGISLGFSPGYESSKPFCKRTDLVSRWNESTEEFDLQPAKSIPVAWIAIQGTEDTICPFPEAEQFVSKVHGAQFIPVQGADHSIVAPEMTSALQKALLRLLGTNPTPAT